MFEDEVFSERYVEFKIKILEEFCVPHAKRYYKELLATGNMHDCDRRATAIINDWLSRF